MRARTSSLARGVLPIDREESKWSAVIRAAGIEAR
jgi:hypothetical protein